MISEAVLKQFDSLCKKSKRQCALCDEKLGPPSKKELKDFKGRAWCSLVSFQHPKFKSKTYKLCGHCYSSILQREKAGDSPRTDK